ncbi:hypothetical protein QQP08_013581 [Theobroma cacao]|nr:hypothetical protein QQP08_013581 [Theobroma cacao]
MVTYLESLCSTQLEFLGPMAKRTLVPFYDKMHYFLGILNGGKGQIEAQIVPLCTYGKFLNGNPLPCSETLQIVWSS